MFTCDGANELRLFRQDSSNICRWKRPKGSTAGGALDDIYFEFCAGRLDGCHFKFLSLAKRTF